MLFLVSAVAVAQRALESASHGAPAQEASPGQASRATLADKAPSSEAPPSEAPPSEAPPDEPPTSAGVAEAVEPTGDSIPSVEPVPSPATPELRPGAATASERTSAPPRPPPTQGELQAALRATPIIMYSATWCGVCRKAKQFLLENRLRYSEIDVDTTPGAWLKVEQLSGRRGVPVIVVDGELTPPGLSPRSIMQAVAHSMERRLGIPGIRFESN